MTALRLKLLGLARACDNNEHMLNDNTFALVREALDATIPNTTLFDRILAEKQRVASMCADCTSPCGRTADPDETILQDAELLGIDLELLQRLLNCGLPYYGKKELDRLFNRIKTLYS